MTKNNPGPLSCYAKAEPDEPMFVLLGRDPTAPFVVTLWIAMRAAMNASDKEQLDDAQACAVSMREWAVKLGRTDNLAKAYDAFRKACFEVAKAEFEAAGNPGAGI